MTTLTSPWPPYPLPFARGQNLVPGLAELVAQTSANDATMWGHTMGGQIVGDVANPAPLNPSGEHGHDHSGGIYGRALFRTIYTGTFDDGGTLDSNVHGTATNRGIRAIAADVDGESTLSDPVRVHVWVPPCQRDGGAYMNLGIHATLELSATALVAADLLQLRLWRANAEVGADGQRVVSLAMTNPQTTGEKRVVSSGLGTRLDVTPGTLNTFFWRIRVSRTGTSSSRGCTVALRELELGVYET